MTERDYIDAMIRSLKRKVYLLDMLIMQNKRQQEELEDEYLTVDDFEKRATEKDDIIREITMLDDGFEEVFDKMKDALEGNKEKYKSEISEMQDLIRKITAKDADVRMGEKRNYELAKTKFSTVKKQIREMKMSRKMVDSYYKNAMAAQSVESSNWDHR